MRLFYTVSLVIALAVTLSCRRKDTPAESIVDPDAPSSLPRAAPGIAKDVDLDTSRTADRWGDPLPKGAVARIHRINPNGHGAGSRGLAFSPDGALLAFVAQDGDCRIWDIKTETELHRLPHDNPYRFPTNHNRCVFSPDGKLLVGDGGAVWEVATGRRIERFPEPPDAGIMPMAFPTLSRDGKTVAFLSHPQENACEVIIYDIASRKQIIKFGKGNRAYGPMFYSADGSVLAVVKAPESVAVPLGFPRPGAKPPALADDSAGLAPADRIPSRRRIHVDVGQRPAHRLESGTGQAFERALRSLDARGSVAAECERVGNLDAQWLVAVERRKRKDAGVYSPIDLACE